VNPMAETEASLDEQLELKKRARRRLVGASALALLAAIVLPMVMDREPRPASQDIQVRIPSQDSGGFASRILPGKPAATPLPPAAPAATAATAAEAKPAVEPKTDTKPEPKAEAPHESPASTVAAAVPVPVKAAEKPAATAPAKPAPKAEAARATEAVAGASADQWVVQLGAYKEAGNVKLLLAKLKGINVAAYTEKFDSPQGPRTRVRAGPFASKEAAEKARTRIKIIGVDGPVAPK